MKVRRNSNVKETALDWKVRRKKVMEEM